MQAGEELLYDYVDTRKGLPGWFKEFTTALVTNAKNTAALRE